MDLNFLNSSWMLDVDLYSNECLFHISPAPKRKHNYLIFYFIFLSVSCILTLTNLAMFLLRLSLGNKVWLDSLIIQRWFIASCAVSLFVGSYCNRFLMRSLAYGDMVFHNGPVISYWLLVIYSMRSFRLHIVWYGTILHWMAIRHWASHTVLLQHSTYPPTH